MYYCIPVGYVNIMSKSTNVLVVIQIVLQYFTMMLTGLLQLL